MDIIELVCLHLDELGLNETDNPEVSHLSPGCPVYYRLGRNIGMKIIYPYNGGTKWLGISRSILDKFTITIWSNGDGDEFQGSGFIFGFNAMDPDFFENMKVIFRREGIIN